MPIMFPGKTRRTKASGFAAAGMLLLFLLTACNPQSTPVATPATQPNQTAVLDADALLHRRLQMVLDADSTFAHLATSAAATEMLDAANERITTAEITLQKTMDSLEQIAQDKTDSSARLQLIVGYFKTLLESRRALSDLRMLLSANSDDSTSMQHTLVQLRAELHQKNKRIAALEQHSKADNTTAYTPNSPEPNTNAPARGETLADLKQRNKNLALALNNLQVKYFTIGRDYLVLKKEHEQTLNELAALRNANRQK